MASEQHRSPFRSFVKERSNILKDIGQFLLAVLKCCSKIVQAFKENEELDKEDVDAITTKISTNLYLMIKSLSLLHGLYGYPNCTNRDVTGKLQVLIKVRCIYRTIYKPYIIPEATAYGINTYVCVY